MLSAECECQTNCFSLRKLAKQQLVNIRFLGLL
jgi:hypothetical protein